MQLPNGATIDIASTYGSVVAMSALSNATSAVGTLAASHGVAVNEVVEITSGWFDVDGIIAKATAVAANDVTFGGVDTTGGRFPAGSGIGSVREITAWTQIPIVLDLGKSGGEPEFYQYFPLAAYAKKQLPTGESPTTLTFKVDAKAAASNAILRAAARAKTRTAFRVTMTDGSIVYWNTLVHMSQVEEMTANVGMTFTVTISLDGPVNRY